MPRSGSLVICVQNLDFSGANQVIVNVIEGGLHEGNVIVVSPRQGPLATKFVETGASVRTGDIIPILSEIRDVFMIICNTIMTAPIVNAMHRRSHPVLWILHEWWTDEMIIENLKMRNLDNMNIDTVKQALSCANHVVCVCEAQRQLYNPTAPSSAIFVGVPAPEADLVKTNDTNLVTFLTLGIVCPRKNQHWAVRQFKKFAGDRQDVRLIVVGARYTRQYEIDYVNKVKEEIDNDPRIELHDVTSDVDKFYARSDVLLFTSLNEVTPLVLSEAMSHRIPIISTNIAGIPEMIEHGTEGFLIDPDDGDACVEYMNTLASNASLRVNMGDNGRYTFDTNFDLNIMVSRYQKLVFDHAPPVILIDMDGCLVDWDKGFIEAWNGRTEVDRTKSYYMEDCVPSEYRDECINLIHSEGFFANLPEMEGGVEALQEMEQRGFKVYLCTAPLLDSYYCAQEKILWIRKHLGEMWLPRTIMAHDKTAVKGDILIDDKPMEELKPGGPHTLATWKQLLFDAPYNSNTPTTRLMHWDHWEKAVYATLDAVPTPSDGLQSRDMRSNSTAALDAVLGEVKLNLKAHKSSNALNSLANNKEEDVGRLKQSFRNDLDDYKKSIQDAGLKLALSGDINGLGLFSSRYENWKERKKKKDSNTRRGRSRSRDLSIYNNNSNNSSGNIKEKNDDQEMEEMNQVITQVVIGDELNSL